MVISLKKKTHRNMWNTVISLYLQILLSRVSSTCYQPWPTIIKLKIPEVNNSEVLNCMPF
jgi:hypothetical protein